MIFLVALFCGLFCDISRRTCFLQRRPEDYAAKHGIFNDIPMLLFLHEGAQFILPQGEDYEVNFREVGCDAPALNELFENRS